MRGAGDPPDTSGSIAAVKRFPTGLLVAAAVVGMGALASACDVTPDAATVNADTISVASLNTELNALQDTSAGQCILQLENPGANFTTTEGAGGSGTFQTGFASTVLNDQVSALLSAQYLAARGVHLSSSLFTVAQQELVAQFDSGIASLAQAAASGSVVSHCTKADGTAYTGTTLLAALPAVIRGNQLADQAVNDVLLARGADLSDAAVLNYYAANTSQYTADCVSDIEVGSQAAADTVVNKLRAGASFAQLATSESLDTQTAASGGSLGCDFQESRVLQALQVTSVTPGEPVTPIQSSPTTWVVYEVVSRTVEPVTSVTSSVREQLLHAPANTARVSAQLQASAHRSSIWVNPQYGTWAGIKIATPVSPPARYLTPDYLVARATQAQAATAG